MNDTNNTNEVTTQPNFRSWDQLTRREQLLSQISDTYKEINGFRPRWNTDHMSDDQLQAWQDEMVLEIHNQIEAERAEELAHEKAVQEAMTPKGFTLGMVWKSNNKSYSPFEDSQEYHESFA
jgi:hypothetical protein